MFIIEPEGTLPIPSLQEIRIEKHFPSRFGARVEFISLCVMIWKELCYVRLFKRKCFFEALRHALWVSNGLLKINY